MPTQEARYCCPIGGRCCPPVTDETFLSHKLTHHRNERGLELRELFAGDRLLLIFNPRFYAIGTNACLSAMAYAGVYEDPSTMPGKRFMHIRNRKMPAIFARYREHLPLFVMICRNRKRVVDGHQEQLNESTADGSERNDDDVLTVWVVSVDISLPVHAMVTVLNRRMDATRTCVMQVRSLHRTQNCLKIMHSTSTQYMRLDEQDLRVLTSDGTEPLYLEVAVKEYAGTLPRNAGEN
ncbi:hypothetical protein KR032_006942 [Drosophila birchii]|nr:hypothetical protein KR032_006942 [Drosophila birchii]